MLAGLSPALSRAAIDAHRDIGSLGVLHVITSLGVGGAQTMLARLLAAEPRDRIHSQVISLVGGGPIAARIRLTGAKVIDLCMPQGLPTPGATYRLARLARAEPVDVVQGWMYHGNLAASFHRLWQRRQVPLLWNVRHSLHDMAEERPARRFLIRLGARLSPMTSAIIYNSVTSARQHHVIGYAEDKTVVIPNGFDCDLFRPDPSRRAWLAQEAAIPPGRLIVGQVARYHAMKDIGGLLRALAQVNADGIDAHLVLTGRGQEQGNLRLVRMIEEAGLHDRVSLLGLRHDVAPIVAGFDVFVLSSAWGEGFSNALGEAMACGVPCVATDVGDSAQIMGPFGELVPRRRPEALAAAISRLAQLGPEGRHAIGVRARERILDRYRLDVIVRRYATLYERLCDPASRSMTPAEMMQ